MNNFSLSYATNVNVNNHGILCMFYVRAFFTVTELLKKRSIFGYRTNFVLIMLVDWHAQDMRLFAFILYLCGKYFFVWTTRSGKSIPSSSKIFVAVQEISCIYFGEMSRPKYQSPVWKWHPPLLLYHTTFVYLKYHAKTISPEFLRAILNEIRNFIGIRKV